jgi:prepilin-type N-terminal cleavage/methylation domain-containing protein
MRRPQQGFTLIELAIVMVILTILAAGLLVPLTTSIETRRIRSANEDMARIQDGLIGYAMSHPVDPTNPASRHYLPCPNYDGSGIEASRNSSGVCSTSNSNQTPLLPWATLGLPPIDPWGDSYGYDVYADYANNQIGFGSGNAPDPASKAAPLTCPTPPSTGYLHIYQSCSSSGSLPNSLVAAQLAAVVISFGPNGWGAYNPANDKRSSKTDPYPANTAPTSTDEVVNTNTGNSAHNFVSHAATDAGSSQGEFDDIVAGLPYSILLNRVCPAGGCP